VAPVFFCASRLNAIFCPFPSSPGDAKQRAEHLLARAVETACYHTGVWLQRACASLLLLGMVAPIASALRDPHVPIGRVAVPEISGLAASDRYPDVYWALQDSGPEPREALYAIRVSEGRMLPWPDGQLVRRVAVLGAPNLDWEELAADGRGNLWIADSGNNKEQRTDLALLRVPEPDPWRDTMARVAERVPFEYPDGPPWGRSFDAEALFFFAERAYLVTKTAEHGVYRFPAALAAGPGITLEKLGILTPPRRGFEGLVTGASIAFDGRRLAVAAGRRRAYVYEAPAGLEPLQQVQALVSRPPRWAPPYAANAKAYQVEATAFKPRSYDLLFAAEEGHVWSFEASLYERFVE